MRLHRRQFLHQAACPALLACSCSAPLFLARGAMALNSKPKRPSGRVLVVLELNGGNDGLNTVVPYRDDEYRKRRPKLQLPTKDLHKIDDRVGFHSSLRGFSQLLEQGRLAVVQSVGYPNPNRSHFESMSIWHAARSDASEETPGWLARRIDDTSAKAKPGRRAGGGRDAPALHISSGVLSSLPQALTGGQAHVPSITDVAQLRRRLGVGAGADPHSQIAALDHLQNLPREKANPLLQFVQKTTTVSYASSARLEKVLRQKKTGAFSYPAELGLAKRLELAAQLIKAGLSTPLYYVRLDGFDTHANQLGTHRNLLFELGQSVRAFFQDLEEAKEADRVLMLVFSEFGRRLSENGSGGTDHGAAAPVFVAGPAVRAGLHGPHPDLQNLLDGDPRFAIDFRQVYATLLEKWLGGTSEAVLGGKFKMLPIV